MKGELAGPGSGTGTWASSFSRSLSVPWCEMGLIVTTSDRWESQNR